MVMQEPTELRVYQHCDNLDKGYFFIDNAKIIYKEVLSMEKRIAKVGMEKNEAIRLATERVDEEFSERENSLRAMLETTSQIVVEEEPAEEYTEIPTEEVIE